MELTEFIKPTLHGLFTCSDMTCIGVFRGSFYFSNNHIAHLNRGMAYEKLDEYSYAGENYRRALELTPEWSLTQLKLDQWLAKQK